MQPAAFPPRPPYQPGMQQLPQMPQQQQMHMQMQQQYAGAYGQPVIQQPMYHMTSAQGGW